MQRFLWQWTVSAVALWIAIYLLRDGVQISAWYHVLWLAPLLGVLGAMVDGVNGVISFLALPVNIFTLGCFGFILGFVLNAVAIYFFSTLIPDIFKVNSFWWGLAFAVVLAMVNGVTSMVSRKKKPKP